MALRPLARTPLVCAADPRYRFVAASPFTHRPPVSVSLAAPLLAALFASLAGAMSGLFGFGGPALISPFLVLVLGLTQHEAQAVALAALLPPVGWPAVLQYRRAGVTVPWRVVTLLVLGFLAGSGAGGWVAQQVSPRALQLAFAVFLLLAGARALVPKAEPEEAAPTATAPDRFLPLALVVGALGGISSGLLGIGGGIVVTPLARRWLGLPRLQAQAATLAMMLPPIGLPAVVAYAVGQGGLPWLLLLGVATGFTVGSAVGGRLAIGLSSRAVSRAYGLVAFVTAGLMAWRALAA